MPTPPSPGQTPAATADSGFQRQASSTSGGRDIGKVSFSGLSEPCAIGSLVEVVINAQGATQGSVLVEAIAPAGKVHRCQVHQRGNTFTATFTPNEVGEWQIAIMYDSEHIRGSPFVCHVYDANLVRVYGLDVGVVGQELKFNVNTSQAGRGDLQVQVLHHGRTIPSNVEKQGSAGLYRVQFTPDGPGHYKIHVYFNNMEVKGSPFSLDIVDASSVSVYGDNLRMASVDKLATFMIHAVGADSKDLTVTISAPSGKKKRARIVPTGDSTYRVEWKPVEAGEHYIDVRLYNQSVQDAPFACNVGDPDLVTVRNIPSQLRHTDLGEPQTFEIDASAAGSGNLEIMINGGRVSCKVKEMGSRLYLATFVPAHPITHIVEMRFNGEPVKGSPWRIEIPLPSSSTNAGESQTSSSTIMTAVNPQTGLPMGSVILAAPLGFPPFSSGVPLTNYAAYLTTPPNFYSTANTTGTTTTTFSSEIERVEGLGGGRFPAHAGGGQSWAEIQGRGLTSACVGKVSNFEIGAQTLLMDDIDVKITGPSTKDIPVKVIVARNGNYRCEYVAPDVGAYRIDLALAGRTVEGSPFLINAYAPHKVFIDPIPGGSVGQPVQFFVDANEAGKGQLEISVNQGRVPNNVQMQGTGRCLVTFIPENSGTYVIDVTFNGELVRGCPIRVEIHDQAGFMDSFAVGARGGGAYQKTPSPPTGGRSWSPAVAGGLLSSSTYSYERRDHSSSNNFHNGAPADQPGGSHTASASYYVTGQPRTIQITPTVESSVSQTVGVPPPAPPPLPVTVQTTGTTPIRTWQQKTTPAAQPTSEIHPPYAKHTSIETKRFESIPSETKRFESANPETKYMARQQVPEPAGAAAFGQRSPPTYPYQPPQRYATVETTTETREDEITITKTFKQQPPFGEDAEKDAEKTSVQTKFTPTAQGPGRIYAAGRVSQPPDVSEHEKKTSAPSFRTEFEERLAARKALSEQRSDEDRSEITSQNRPPYRSEFEERLARKAADREEKYVGGDRQPDSSSKYTGMTTVASYGVQEDAQVTTGYRRPGVMDKSHQPTTTHTLAIEKELREIPVGKEEKEVGKRPYTEKTTEYRQFEKVPFEKVSEQKSVEKIIEQRSYEKTPEQRERYPYPDYDKTPLAERQDLSRSASEASSNEDYEERRRHLQGSVQPKSKIEETVLAAKTPSPSGYVDVKAIKVDFPDFVGASETGSTVPVVRIKKTTRFEIKPNIFDRDDLKVNLLTPSKSALDYRVIENRHGFAVEFTPTDVGTHKAHVLIRDEPLPLSPFVIKVYDPDKILVTGIEEGVVNNPVQFTVDATNAGYGSLEIAIKDNDDNIIPSKVSAQQDSMSKFTVTFTPQKADDYGIHVSFNQEPLRGSPFLTTVRPAASESTWSATATPVITTAPMITTQTVISSSTTTTTQSYTPPNGALKAAPGAAMSGVGAAKLLGEDRTKERLPKLAPVAKTASFLVAGAEGLTKPRVEVKGPNGKVLPADVVDVGDSTYKIEFNPQVVGDHTVEVKLGDAQAQGSPFTCRVYDSKKIKVGEIPNGVVGKPAHFVVDAGEAGVGNLEVAVNDGRIPSMAHSLGQHRYDISFAPKDTSDHTISIRFNNEPVPGSPFACKIAKASQIVASGRGLERVPTRRPVSFDVDTQGAAGGNLQVKIKDPTGQDVPVKITGDAEKTFKVEYTPQAVGNYTIDIAHSGVTANNSPFTVKAYDASRVKLLPAETNGVGKPASFYIDAAKAGAGNMEIIVSVDGRNVPNYVTSEGSAKFKVSFTPQETKTHVVTVKFNGEMVPGSPMSCNIGGGHPCVVAGENLRQAIVGKPATFVVEAPETMDKDCNVLITAPSQKSVHYSTSRLKKGAFEYRFVPQEIGPHSIRVERNGKRIGDSPFRCNVFDPTQVSVSRIGPAVVGKQMKFTVDISKAGDGVVTVNIVDTLRKTSVPCRVQSTSMGSSYEAVFTPVDKMAPLAVSVFFNDVQLENSPYTCHVFNILQVEASGSGLQLAQIDQVTNFMVDLPNDVHEQDLNVQITDAAKRLVPCSMKKSPGGNSKFLIEYVPKELGPHWIDVRFAEHPIVGNPFCCETFDMRRVKVFGLKDGHVGKEQKLEVDYSEAGHGYVDVCVRDKRGAFRCFMQPVGDGVSSCTFTPRQSGAHTIDVTFNGVAITGSPLDCVVRDASAIYAHGPGLKEACAELTAHFTVVLAGAGRGELDVVVTAPDGGAVPVKCFQQKDGNFRVEYTPNVVGTHRIDISFGDQPVAESPYICEVFDPTLVKMAQEQHVFAPGQEAALRVSRKNAGNATLAVQVTDPNGKLLPVDVVPVSHNEDEVRFTPLMPGQHHVSLLYGGYDVADSPLPVLFSVDEPDMPGAYGDGLSRAVVNEEAAFVVDVKKLKGELQVDVTGPNRQRTKHAVRRKGDGLYETLYTPAEAGIHTVTLLWNGKPISGSPYSVAALDPEKVLIAGPSTEETIRVGTQKELRIDTTSAGPGKLRAEVRGPGGPLASRLDEASSGQYKLFFTPNFEGEHSVYLYWSDLPVPTCPRIYMVERGPSAHGESLFTTEVVKSAVSKESLKRGKDGGESPSVSRGEHGRGASDVVVSKDWTNRVAILGREIQTTIDTRRAGAGELTAQCIGPNKLAFCKLYGRPDGTYALHFKPEETGKHSLVVKYNDEHVPGSPFAVSVANPPDPSKVRVFGPGVEHGILSKFKSDFSVDTQGAGAGQLTVRVRGPKGAFNVEMVRESKYDRQIRCKYEPKEPGDYQIEVKWAGEHVPGSPFLVMIFDTQQELERFLSGQPVTPTPPLPFLPPGWVGPPPPGLMFPPSPAGPPAIMPPSPMLGFRPPPPRALTYGPMPPGPFPLYAGGSPQLRYQNGY